MNAQVAHHEVARSLNVLAPLIKEKVQRAREAAEEAAKPYWSEIGDLLVEAKDQFERVSEFYGWASRHFGFSQTQTKRYEGSARLIAPQNRARGQTLSDAMRSVGRSPRGSTRGGERDWRAPVDHIAERARRDEARLADELNRKQERDAERALALRMIDIGYKVLAKELHPDKGGSRDTMARLNRARDRLKNLA